MYSRRNIAKRDHEFHSLLIHQNCRLTFQYLKINIALRHNSFNTHHAIASLQFYISINNFILNFIKNLTQCTN